MGTVIQLCHVPDLFINIHDSSERKLSYSSNTLLVSAVNYVALDIHKTREVVKEGEGRVLGKKSSAYSNECVISCNHEVMIELKFAYWPKAN